MVETKVACLLRYLDLGLPCVGSDRVIEVGF